MFNSNASNRAGRSGIFSNKITRAPTQGFWNSEFGINRNTEEAAPDREGFTGGVAGRHLTDQTDSDPELTVEKQSALNSPINFPTFSAPEHAPGNPTYNNLSSTFHSNLTRGDVVEKNQQRAASVSTSDDVASNTVSECQGFIYRNAKDEVGLNEYDSGKRTVFDKTATNMRDNFCTDSNINCTSILDQTIANTKFSNSDNNPLKKRNDSPSNSFLNDSTILEINNPFKGSKPNRMNYAKSNRQTGYVPVVRQLEDIFLEDERNKNLYLKVFEDDEEVHVIGASDTIACIDRWTDINLNSKILRNIERCGYTHPRKVQAYTIPLILDGFDLKIQAETGSGKSASFLIPLLHKIATEEETRTRPRSEHHQPRAVIVAPTRELTLQLYEQCRKLAHMLEIKITKAYGEYDFRENSEEVLKGSDVVFGTPGRLIHFFKCGIIGLERLRYFVIDEADRLLDECFEEDFIQMIAIQGFPKKKNLQTILCSATFPATSAHWMDSILKSKHVVVKNARANAPNARICQTFEECTANNKVSKLLAYCKRIIENNGVQQDSIRQKENIPETEKHQCNDLSNASTPRILVFVDECQKSDAYAFFLNYNGVSALSLNSKRGQKAREETLSRFRDSRISVIVATDVCSRGLDIKNLDHVINVDLPKSFTTYVQRIGRTGRLKTGFAHSFFDLINDREILPDLIKSLTSEKLPVPQFMVETINSAVKPTSNLDAHLLEEPEFDK